MEESTYTISFKRGRKHESFLFTSENGDTRIKDFVFGIFKKRVSKPAKLSYKNGVVLSLVCSSSKKVLLQCRVYNRSVFQTAAEFVRSAKEYLV